MEFISIYTEQSCPFLITCRLHKADDENGTNGFCCNKPGGRFQYFKFQKGLVGNAFIRVILDQGRLKI
jgi:hypothetical protein